MWAVYRACVFPFIFFFTTIYARLGGICFSLTLFLFLVLQLVHLFLPPVSLLNRLFLILLSLQPFLLPFLLSSSPSISAFFLHLPLFPSEFSSFIVVASSHTFTSATQSVRRIKYLLSSEKKMKANLISPPTLIR